MQNLTEQGYKFFNKDTGYAEFILPERWGWGVVYQDGTELHQFDAATGLFHQWAEIDQERVKYFCMQHLANPEKMYTVVVEPGMKIYHGYVVWKQKTDGVAKDMAKVYRFGWENLGAGTAARFHIMPDDNVIMGLRPIKIADFAAVEPEPAEVN